MKLLDRNRTEKQTPPVGKTRLPEKVAPTRPIEKPEATDAPRERLEKSAEARESAKDRGPAAGFFGALGSNFGGEEGAHSGASADEHSATRETPNEEHDHLVLADESERTDEIAEEQTEAVSDGVEDGDEFDFTNSEGQEIQATVERDDDGNYTVETSQGADFDVNFDGDFTEQEREEAIAEVIDYQSQTPEDFQGSTEEIVFTDEEDEDGAAASYRDSDRRITFYNGTENLDERVYIHEAAHSVGYEAERRSDSFGDRNFPWRNNKEENERGAPDGWQDAIDTDGTSVSEYANTNWREDFAEFYLAYHEAAEAGPDALEELREQYPERYALVEETYGQAA